jgi:hypothetical protein
MDGYYRNKILTRETFTSDGFLRTGDLGFFDERGLLRIAGRRKEVIIKSGVNIVPEEIDTVLRQLDGIADAKSIGLPDEVLGELVCSVCVMKDGVAPPRPAEIRRFVGQHLAAFKCPDRIVFAGHIPKTPTGKPRVGELRRMVSGELASELLARLDTWKFSARIRRSAIGYGAPQAGLVSGEDDVRRLLGLRQARRDRRSGSRGDGPPRSTRRSPTGRPTRCGARCSS